MYDNSVAFNGFQEALIFSFVQVNDRRPRVRLYNLHSRTGAKDASGPWMQNVPRASAVSVTRAAFCARH